MILGYVRVSTDRQAEDGATSPEVQERRVRAVALDRGAGPYDVVIYSDLGVSGSVPLSERPQGGKMLKDAKPGDVIVASKLDRLFRSSLDALHTLDAFRKRGVDVILLDVSNEPLTSSPVAKLFLTMLAAFADFERQLIAERMGDGRRAKRESNGHLGGQPPYGFKVVGEKKLARLEPVEEEQATLMQVVDICKKSGSFWLAAREAEKQGLRDRAGSPFRINQLQRLVARQEKAC